MANSSTNKNIISTVGGILQAVTAVKSDTWQQTPTANTWYSVTGLNVSITPTRSDSTILLFATVSFNNSGTVGSSQALKFYDTTNAVDIGVNSGGTYPATVAWENPNTSVQQGVQMVAAVASSNTSARTYEVQALASTTTGIGVNRRGNADGDTASILRGWSNIIAIEVI